MSFNRNSNKPKNILILCSRDTSNWPEQHRFIANLPDQVTDFNEQHWLGLMFLHLEIIKDVLMIF